MQAIADFKVWIEKWGQDARCKEKISFEIYQNTMLQKDISKAIVAQEFAACLLAYKDSKKLKLRDCLLEAPSLQYLIKAIEFVTKPI